MLPKMIKKAPMILVARISTFNKNISAMKERTTWVYCKGAKIDAFSRPKAFEKNIYPTNPRNERMIMI